MPAGRVHIGCHTNTAGATVLKEKPNKKEVSPGEGGDWIGREGLGEACPRPLRDTPLVLRACRRGLKPGAHKAMICFKRTDRTRVSVTPLKTVSFGERDPGGQGSKGDVI